MTKNLKASLNSSDNQLLASKTRDGKVLLTDDKGVQAKLADPHAINETISRYDYLLHDSKGPVLSNFLHLLDYKDGCDLSQDEFTEADYRKAM